MLMEYEDFSDTEHLQEYISNQGFKHNVEVIQKNVELDSKSNNVFDETMPYGSQINSEDECLDRNITHIGQMQNDKLENLNNVLKFIFNVNKSMHIDSFYNDIEEWHGIVESIDDSSEKFKVLFGDELDEMQHIVEFDMEDMQFASDLKLLKVGANIIWIFGHETQIIKVDNTLKLGPRTNVSRLTIRRTKTLTKKQVKEAEEYAESWTKFFRKCKFED